MSSESAALKLGRKIVKGRAAIDEIAEFVSLYLPAAVNQINALFSPRQLAKRDNSVEPLPTDRRQLSSYRTRLGTMLEYALSTHIDKAIQDAFGVDLRLTFAVAHEYPDFYIRDAVLDQRVRVEMKAVDVESDEQAARFEVLSALIQGKKDVVVIIAWEWFDDHLENGTACAYPQIFSYIVVPAAELASERDQSVVLRGGRVESDRILVPSKKYPGQLAVDQHNAGKILRLVHQSRKAEPFNLSEHIQRYLQFVDTIKSRATTRRPAKKQAGKSSPKAR
ncbi:MAG TPA: hypothetical protein VEX60_09435 [Pyrinomonadaceae bacterium]|nr:hypothetical protein [Pyrinomonadaceae bacterium]